MSDATRRHRMLARRAARLTQEQERALIEAYRAGDVASGMMLVSASIGLAIHVAYRHSPGTYDADDMIQAASVGLIKALRKFDPDLGTWSNYAAKWAANEVRKYLRTKRLIALPADLASSAQMRAARDTLSVESMMKLGATEARARDVIEATLTKVVSMSAPCGEFGTFEDRMGEEDPERDTMMERTVERAMATLTPLEARIIREHLMDETETLTSLAEKLGVSVERVRQIELRGLWKLKDALNAAGVDGQAALQPVPVKPPRPRVERKRCVKITETDLASVRLLLERGLTIRELAPRYKVSVQWLENLVRGRYTRAA
jgi:RNA polymerase sigma factor (sigma-70 family)